jgi:hypothetical protein
MKEERLQSVDYFGYTRIVRNETYWEVLFMAMTERRTGAVIACL